MGLETEGHLTEEEMGEERPYSKCIVLGGGFRKEKPNDLNLPTKLRALAAGVLASQGKITSLIFTGGIVPYGDRPVSVAMKEYMLGKFPGLNNIEIETEEESVDTKENAWKTAKKLSPEDLSNVLVLSNDFHLKRAKEDFLRAGINPEMISAEELASLRSSHHEELVDNYQNSCSRKKSSAIEAILEGINKVDPEILTSIARKLRR
jgi:uncharacterized SAM-binding protein YcdF (DUF218 family)